VDLTGEMHKHGNGPGVRSISLPRESATLDFRGSLPVERRSVVQHDVD
jgi:hypothetical protein